jgi:hypothetical protein
VSRCSTMVCLPGSPPSTLFCTIVRIVSPGVLIAAPNTPAQKPNREETRKKVWRRIRTCECFSLGEMR